MSQAELISKCLNGDRNPYCNTCPAHHSQNGECCFGLRFEYPHKDCDACVIRVDCAAQTQAFSQSGYPVRPVIRPGAPRAYYPSVQSVRQPGQPVRVMTRYEAPQYGPPAPMQYGPPQYELPEEEPRHLWFLRRVVHGLLEGAVEALLHCFRQTRPK